MPLVVRYVETYNRVLGDENVNMVALDHAGDVAGAASIDGHVVVALNTVAQRSKHRTDITCRLNNHTPTKTVEITTTALYLRTSGL